MILFDIFLFILLSVFLTYICCVNIFWFIIMCLYASLRIKVKPSWFNWFEITKLLSCVVGIIVVEFYPRFINYVMIINILEAVIRDKYFINSLFGICVAICVNTDSFMWICMYSLWNAFFTYTYGFSWSTRVQLLTPVILYTHTGWIKARVYSLMINMILRSIEFTYMFTSGKSFLTY
jgi:hypothetical protein